MKTKNKFERMPNGDVKGIMTYPETKVTIPVNGEDMLIGKTPEHEVCQIILKDKIEYLIKYLKEQKELIQKRIDAAKEVIKETEGVNCDKLAEAIRKIPADKVKQKLQGLDRMCKDIYMRQGAIDNLKVLEENIKSFDEQLEFLEN